MRICKCGAIFLPLYIFISSCGFAGRLLDSTQETTFPSSSPTVFLQTDPLDTIEPSIRPSTVSATPEPIPTSTPSPNSTVEANPTLPDFGLDIALISDESSLPFSQLPQDILLDIWFTTGGGGFGGCPYSEDGPHFLIKNASGPVSPIAEAEIEIHELTTIHSCGWENNEAVTITLFDPRGVIINAISVRFQDGHAILFDVKTNIISDFPGTYIILFEGFSGTISYRLKVIPSIGPRVFWEDDGTIILYGFQPKETIAVYQYSTGSGKAGGPGQHYSLEVWNRFQVNEVGNLIIRSALNTDVFWVAVVGDNSGQITPNFKSSPRLHGVTPPSIIGITPSTSGDSPTPTSLNKNWPVSNTGVEACHLEFGTIISAGEGANAWSEPDVNEGTLVKQMAFQTELTVKSGPVWGSIVFNSNQSGWWWLVVETATGIEGWVWQSRFIECSS